MNVLVACEESQRVCIAFRERGHNAFSCDIEPCSGGNLEWHIMQDVVPLLNGRCSFKTMDGIEHLIDGKWDLIIAFPPCTHLAVSGARYFEQKRKDGRQQHGIDFFMGFVNADCEKIAIENPIGIMSTHYRKPDQIVQPWMFGHGETKATCLWTKGLPNLKTNGLKKPCNADLFGRFPSGKAKTWEDQVNSDRSRARSKTFPGIASAMAEQWG